jgi:DNA-binding PadR family transcriptional regulator
MSKQQWFNSQGTFWPWASMTFGGRARFFESGEVRLAILSLLSEGPKHGYQLMKELAERSGGLYRSSAGSVYPTLQQLEDEGLIQSDQPVGKRDYAITPAGLDELAKDPEAVRRIWERAEKWEEFGQYMKPDAIAMFKPLGALTKSVWAAAGRLSGSPDGENRLREILDRARQEVEALK